MSSPVSKTSFSSFQYEEDMKTVKVLGKPKKPRAESVNSKGRPYSANRALKAVNHLYGPPAVKAAGPEDVRNESPQALYSNLSREEIVGAYIEAKKRVKVLEANSASLKTENTRCSNEATKLQRKVEKLLESSALQTAEGNKSVIPPSAEVRRELEKSLLVRQLKTQVTGLRSAAAELELELETLKRSQKGTKIVELSNEKEEYYLETLRLKQVVRELRDSLQSERQRRVWDKKRNGAGEEIRKEVARLTSGYQNMLSGIAPSVGQKNVRPANANNTSSSTRRPQSASKKIISSFAVNASNATTLHHLNNASSSSLMTSPKSEPRVTETLFAKRSFSKEEEPDELDYFNGIHNDDTDQRFSDDVNYNGGFKTISPSNNQNDQKTESVKVFVKIISTNGLINVERNPNDENDVFLLLSFDDVWDANTSTVWEGGSAVSWSYSPVDDKHKDMKWYTTLDRLQSGYLKVIAMDENEVSVSREIGENISIQM